MRDTKGSDLVYSQLSSVRFRRRHGISQRLVVLGENMLMVMVNRQ